QAAAGVAVTGGPGDQAGLGGGTQRPQEQGQNSDQSQSVAGRRQVHRWFLSWREASSGDVATAGDGGDSTESSRKSGQANFPFYPWLKPHVNNPPPIHACSP